MEVAKLCYQKQYGEEGRTLNTFRVAAKHAIGGDAGAYGAWASLSNGPNGGGMEV